MNFFEGELVANGSILFRNKSFDLQIPEKLSHGLHKEKTDKIILGVRPEDFALEPTESKKENSLEALVEVIEPMGSENYLYLKTEDQDFIIRTAPSTNVKIKDKIQLYINLENIHLFDEKTSEALLS